MNTNIYEFCRILVQLRILFNKGGMFFRGEKHSFVNSSVASWKTWKMSLIRKKTPVAGITISDFLEIC